MEPMKQNVPQFILAIFALSAIGALSVALMLLLGQQNDMPNDPTAPTQVGEQPLIIATEDVPTQTVTATPSPSQTPTALPSASPTRVATLTPANSATPSAAESEIASNNAGCPPPEGWQAITVQAGDTLFAFQLGSGNEATVDDIIAANCLDSRFIFEGQTLWLPTGAAENAPSSQPIPTAFPTDANAPPPPQGLSRAPQCPCSLTIRPGWRLEQVAEVIDSLPVGFSGAELLNLQIGSLTSREFFGGAPPTTSLEGYMMPATYAITNEMGITAFANLVLDNFAAQTAGLWGDAAAVGLTPWEAVNLASIINKESGSFNQMVLISSVFHNRINSGRGLASTVTTMYALGGPGDWWRFPAQGQLSTFDSPYNTNLYRGLPPTPIASPVPDAIRAAIYPAQTDYLYFTGDCRAPGNAFAVTYEEHLANVRCE